ncbi:MAG: HDOD domain-containing protein [Bacteroidales bacterium]|nr:HDOD domain-containing protein [Candidatus Latescibacterota bacterium]
MTNKVDELFRNVKSLPTLPIVVQKIFASINDPKIGARQLAQIITSDQTLTARVLKLVNSSFFGLRGKVQNIHHAVTMLGFSTIRQICLGASICGKFQHVKGTTDFSGPGFWEHSIGAAVIAKEICKNAVKIEGDICYTLGLIHDIGKLLLVEHHTDKFMDAILRAKRESKPLEQIEVEIFGVDHAEIGNWLFRKWNFPRDSRRAVKNHHSARIEMISPVSPDALTGIVFFANQVAHHLNLGASGDTNIVLDEENFRKFFGISFADVNLDTPRIREEVAISLEVLGAVQGTPA